MQFVIEPVSGNYRIVPGELTTNDAEDSDFSLTGGFGCQIASFGLGFFVDAAEDSIQGALLPPLCAAPGPAYMQPCPGP